MCDHCGCGQPHEHHEHNHQHDHQSSQRIALQQDVLAHDKAHAQQIRERLTKLDARLVNVIGSPGCGKTQLLTTLIGELGDRLRCVVVEGDLATDNDAERIRATGAPVVQIQTGTACHLSAHDVEHALEKLPVENKTLVLVENVGNLVCPSMFDIGESLRLVCLSVTEGTDKPQKYPVSFRDADLVVITKSDLLPHVDFDLDACQRLISDIAPDKSWVVVSAPPGPSNGPDEGITELAQRLEALWT